MAIEIELRDVVDDDYPVFLEHRRDAVAARMAAFGTRDEDAGQMAARLKRGIAAGTSTLKTITHQGAVVGLVSTFLFEGKPQVTYWVARSHWGRGVATAALAKLLELVPERPLYASAAKDNVGSRRVLEKCGFRETVTERAFAQARGEEVDEVFFERR